MISISTGVRSLPTIYAANHSTRELYVNTENIFVLLFVPMLLQTRIVLCWIIFVKTPGNGDGKFLWLTCFSEDSLLLWSLYYTTIITMWPLNVFEIVFFAIWRICKKSSLANKIPIYSNNHEAKAEKGWRLLDIIYLLVLQIFSIHQMMLFLWLSQLMVYSDLDECPSSLAKCSWAMLWVFSRCTMF